MAIPLLNNSPKSVTNTVILSTDDINKVPAISHVTSVTEDYKWLGFYGGFNLSDKEKFNIRKSGRNLKPIEYDKFLELDEIKGLEYYVANKEQFLELGNVKVATVTDKGTKKEILIINLPLLKALVEKSKGEKVTD